MKKSKPILTVAHVAYRVLNPEGSSKYQPYLGDQGNILSSATILVPERSKLDEFSKLEKGWNYGEGRKISRDVLQLAQDFSNAVILQGILEQDFFPGPDGSVQISCFLGESSCDVIVNPDLTVMVEYEKDKIVEEDTYSKERFNPNSFAIRMNRKLRNLECQAHTLDYSTLNTTGARKRKDSYQWHSDLQAKMAEYPRFAKNVQKKNPVLYVPI